jgi:sirohydrochlorin ferrochelatase
MSDAAPATAGTDAAPAQEATPQQETFSRDYVESLRSEAAKHRTEKNSAVDAAKAAVIKEYEGKAAERDSKISEIETNYATAQLDLLKLRSVLEAGISTDDVLEVVSLVQGSDEESVNESVNRVKALLGKAPSKVAAVDPTQGQGSHVPLNGNPVLDILKRAVGA